MEDDIEWNGRTVVWAVPVKQNTLRIGCEINTS